MNTTDDLVCAECGENPCNGRDSHKGIADTPRSTVEARREFTRLKETVRQYFCEYRYGDGITMGLALTRMLVAAGLDPVWPEDIPRHDRSAVKIIEEHTAFQQEASSLRTDIQKGKFDLVAFHEKLTLCIKEWVQMAVEDAPTPQHAEALRFCAAELAKLLPE